jgi:hypothetical protein
MAQAMFPESFTKPYQALPKFKATLSNTNSGLVATQRGFLSPGTMPLSRSSQLRPDERGFSRDFGTFCIARMHVTPFDIVPRRIWSQILAPD